VSFAVPGRGLSRKSGVRSVYGGVSPPKTTSATQDFGRELLAQREWLPRLGWFQVAELDPAEGWCAGPGALGKAGN